MTFFDAIPGAADHGGAVARTFAATDGQALIRAEDRFRFADVNRRPFGFGHRLHQTGLFTLDGILSLADRLPDGPAFKGWQNGVVAIDAGWDTRPEDQLGVEQTLSGIADNNSLVVLKHIEQDRVFGPVLKGLLQEVYDLSSRQFRDDVMIGECLVFVNSPRRVTAYHFDLEASFLLQIEGTKTVHAWPCGDRSVVTTEEIEDYCGAGNLSAAIYKPENEAAASTFGLEAGDGVHFPSIGPHWVQNGDTISISVNVNYDVRSLHGGLRPVIGFNRHLRALGLHPSDPGRFPVADRLKADAWFAARAAKRSARRVMGKMRNGEDYPAWRPRRA